MEAKPLFDGYSINERGEVFNSKGMLIRHRMLRERATITLKGKQKAVGTLLLEAFVGPKPKGSVPKPLDGDHSNLDADNWHWEISGMEKKRQCAEMESDSEFWELNETQTEKYSYFLSLIRPHQPKKIRACLRCRREYRMRGHVCSKCNETNQRAGALC